jgi:hypothetical protein
MFYQTVTDPARQADLLRRRPYGVIHVADGRLVSIRLRPFPKIASVVEARVVGERMHNAAEGLLARLRRGVRAPGCWLYYNQPLSCPNYLALAYGVSQRGCGLASVQAAARVLDEIARLKQSDAILCDVAGSAISERVLARFGWQPHAPSRWHRNYIKRFYGEYPPPLEGWPISIAVGVPSAMHGWAGGLVDGPLIDGPLVESDNAPENCEWMETQ